MFWVCVFVRRFFLPPSEWLFLYLSLSPYLNLSDTSLRVCADVTQRVDSKSQQQRMEYQSVCLYVWMVINNLFLDGFAFFFACNRNVYLCGGKWMVRATVRRACAIVH